MADAMKSDTTGSRVLREWNEQRARERLVAARGKADMRRTWWSGVAGAGGAGGFDGGGIGRLTASLAQWSGAINADLDGVLSILRARARALCQNNEFGRRFLTLVASNVIGSSGPMLQVRAMQDRGSDLDKVANDTIEQAYTEWCGRCDVRGIMDFAQLQRVGVTSAARDGETLLRIVRDRNLPNGIGLQLLEADRLDETINTTLSNGNRIRQGVEVNSYLRPVAYYIKASHPGENYQAVAPAPERVPADQVIHVYLPQRAEQIRGYTWLHAVVLRMAMLHAYEEAAVIAARVGAAKMGVFKRSDEAAGNLDSLADGVSPDGIRQMSAAPGEFMELPIGYELQAWNPEYPHANFESFLKACFRGVATGLDIAAHNLTGDMTDVNYSSARIAELSERDQWQVLQAWWIRTVTRPVFASWLESALIRGEIVFPRGKALPAERLSKFLKASRFQGRRWQWIDPQKEIGAVSDAIGLGLQSRTAVAASQGREFEDVVDELAQEKKLLEAAGLPWQVGKAPAQAKPAESSSSSSGEDGGAGGAGEDGKQPKGADQ